MCVSRLPSTAPRRSLSRLARESTADGRLFDAVASDLEDGDGHATATGVRVIWTGDHLDAVRRLQETLVGPAHTAVAGN